VACRKYRRIALPELKGRQAKNPTCVKHTSTTFFVPLPELLVLHHLVLGRSEALFSKLGGDVLHGFVGPWVPRVLAFQVFTHFEVTFLPK
jgi:hypothetical protein